MGKKAQQLKEAAKRLPKKKRVSLLRFWGGIFKKILLLTVFAAYLVGGSIATMTWAKAARFRSLETDQMLLRMDHYRERYKFFDAVFMFDVQPRERAVEVINALEPIAPVIEPVFYFQLAKRYEQIGDMDKAVFWHLLASFRLRLDSLRCEGQDGFKAVEIYSELYLTPMLTYYVGEDIDRTERIFDRMMQWDAENPPQTSPQYFCRIARMYLYSRLPGYTGKPVRKEMWPLIYQAHRETVKEGFIPEIRRMAVEMQAAENSGATAETPPVPEDAEP